MTIDREELAAIKKRNEVTYRFKQNLTEAEADRSALLDALEAAEAGLREALVDCAHDLECEINADFPADVRAQYPVMHSPRGWVASGIRAGIHEIERLRARVADLEAESDRYKWQRDDMTRKLPPCPEGMTRSEQLASIVKRVSELEIQLEQSRSLGKLGGNMKKTLKLSIASAWLLGSISRSRVVEVAQELGFRLDEIENLKILEAAQHESELDEHKQ